jgi:hypothetical protein
MKLKRKRYNQTKKKHYHALNYALEGICKITARYATYIQPISTPNHAMILLTQRAGHMPGFLLANRYCLPAQLCRTIKDGIKQGSATPHQLS